VFDAFLMTLLCCAAEPVRQQPPAPPISRVSLALARPPSPLRQSIVRAKREAPLARQRAVIKPGRRDSIWNGLLIGAGIGATGGYVWARHECGSNDTECAAITNPVGILGGAGIGAAIGAILDAFS
jgi:hypothetical protein